MFSKVGNGQGRKPGCKKTGGRVAGTPNKTSVGWSETLRSHFFDLPNEAIKLFFAPNCEPELKFQILKFLAEYTAQKRKPIEVPEEEHEPEEPADIITLVKNE